MSLAHIRSQKSRTYTLFNLTSTVVTTTTGVNGTAITPTPYREGTFHTRLAVNTSGAPAIYLDAGVVHTGMTTTTWAQYATIDADLTTTANNTVTSVEVLPNYLRARIPVITTTASVTTITVDVECVLKT